MARLDAILFFDWRVMMLCMAMPVMTYSVVGPAMTASMAASETTP